MAIQDVVRWSNTSFGEVENMVKEITNGVILRVSGDFIADIIREKSAEPMSNIEVLENIWPTRDYYVYYAEHPDTSYMTRIQVKEGSHRDFTVQTLKVSESALCAITHEVYIFRLS